ALGSGAVSSSVERRREAATLRDPGATERLRDRVGRLVFGTDIFISYSRRDTSYVLSLGNALVAKGMSPYIDQWASPVGAELQPSLKRGLARASMLVVVATESSVESANVELEVRRFLTKERPVCIIDVGGTLMRAGWAEVVRGPQPIPEFTATPAT